MLGDPDSSVSVHVAEIGGRVVGFCSVGSPQDIADRHPDIAELHTIYVEPQYQARGAGARLLAAAELTMREWGALAGVLWVLAGNESATSFYVRHGWRADGTVKTDTIFGIEVREARYRKTFNEGNG